MKPHGFFRANVWTKNHWTRFSVDWPRVRSDPGFLFPDMIWTTLKKDLWPHSPNMHMSLFQVGWPTRIQRKTESKLHSRGTPVFVAQHATGTCCRSCLEKWHAIPKGRKVTSTEQQRIVDLIIEWIRRQLPGQLPEKENKTETDVHECDTAIRETQRELFNRREEQ